MKLMPAIDINTGKAGRVSAMPATPWQPWLFLLTLSWGLALSSGCVSMAHSTNIKPPSDAATLSVQHKFRIESVQYQVIDNGRPLGTVPFPPKPPETNPVGAKSPDAEKLASHQAPMFWDEARWLAELKKTAGSRYPLVFSDGPGSCPLSISIKVVGHAPSPALMALPMLLTGLVLGGILPLYGSETADFEVSPALRLNDGLTAQPLATIQFHRKGGSWITVFTPLGLIPVPGHADKREIMNLFPFVMNPDSPVPVPEKGFLLNVESCVDAIVLSIQSSKEEIQKALAGSSSGVGIVSP